MVPAMADNNIPLKWLLARIKKVYTGYNGVVGVVQLLIVKAIYNRPVVKLKLFVRNS